MSTNHPSPSEDSQNIFEPPPVSETETHDASHYASTNVPQRPPFPTATLVLGLVAVVVAILVLGANLLQWTYDPAIVGASILAGAGFLLIIGGILTHRDSSRKANS